MFLIFFQYISSSIRLSISGSAVVVDSLEFVEVEIVPVADVIFAVPAAVVEADIVVASGVVADILVVVPGEAELVVIVEVTVVFPTAAIDVLFNPVPANDTVVPFEVFIIVVFVTLFVVVGIGVLLNVVDATTVVFLALLEVEMLAVVVTVLLAAETDPIAGVVMLPTVVVFKPEPALVNPVDCIDDALRKSKRLTFQVIRDTILLKPCSSLVNSSCVRI